FCVFHLMHLLRPRTHLFPYTTLFRSLDANGVVLRFGGEVMKNVAGYDISRLLAGSMGIFGPLLEVSLKVAPLPLAEETRVLELRSEEHTSELQSRENLVCRLLLE